MESRSIAREISLLLLTQISENVIKDLNANSIEILLNKALDSLMQHWRDELDNCALTLEIAQQALLDSELQESDVNSLVRVRKHLSDCLDHSENVLNSLSESIEFPRLLALGDQIEVRRLVLERVNIVSQRFQEIDEILDQTMEGWRLKRLPRIDRDILRLAFVDLNHLQIPPAVACNEAVNLANRYSDDQGRRMINGVLRRLQSSSPVKA